MTNIHDYPRLIEEGSAELYKASERHRAATEAIKRIELQTLVYVAGELNAQGKLLHSNESARSAAVYARLTEHTAYQSLLQDQAFAHEQRAAFEATIQRLRDELRIALIDYEFTTLGRRER